MARGGARAGAGRPNGIHTSWSKESQDRLRAKIQTEKIIQNLNDMATGAKAADSPTIAAGLGLLRKVIPDLSQSENTTELLHRYVARVPEKAATPDQWQHQHSPLETQH